ncbi:CopG family antitoxin [Methylobacter tundripaludum]|uniref:CopG family antitoxin n=1 Tax=Methylobacter tundripaludum TaxID=173365 RepID=UPI000A6E1503
MKKNVPKLKTDKAAETFVDEADLTRYDLSGMKPVSFEFQPKYKSITMRLPETLFDAIKKEPSAQAYLINGLFVRLLKTHCILGNKPNLPLICPVGRQLFVARHFNVN